MSRHPFDLQMELDTRDIRLDWAALHLARDVFPAFNADRYLRQLDEWAAAVQAHRPGLAATLRYQALREVLFESYGLTGAAHAFQDPRSNYLNHVLDTGHGAPISLSIVWIEVARRLNWPVAGVSLPGQFIVRFDDPERFVLADPFADGRALTVADCRQIVRARFDGRIWLQAEHLRPISTRALLARLLRNLRNAYLAQGDLSRVAMTLRRLAAVQPDNAQTLQELAAVCTRQGDVRRAAAHLELYLRRAPDAHDRHVVRHNLKQLHAAMLAQN